SRCSRPPCSRLRPRSQPLSPPRLVPTAPHHVFAVRGWACPRRPGSSRRSWPSPACSSRSPAAPPVPLERSPVAAPHVALLEAVALDLVLQRPERQVEQARRLGLAAVDLTQHGDERVALEALDAILEGARVRRGERREGGGRRSGLGLCG